MTSVIVIGAGLSGLTTARYLHAAGIHVTVLESSDGPGGRARTDLINGYRCDRGFQVINSKYPEVKKTGLIASLDFREINPNVRIVESDREYLVGRNHPTRLIANSFKGRRELMDEFLTGVFLSDPNRISRSVSRQIKKSFLLGKPGIPAEGVGEFSKALAQSLPDVRYQHSVSRVEGRAVVGEFGRIEADSIVVATQAKTANSLLSLYMPHETLSSTTWYHTTQDELFSPQFMAIPKNSAIVNSIVISHLSERYAPVGSHLVATTTIQNLSEERVKTELADLWGSANWELVQRYDITDSLPLMSPGSSRPIIRASESTILAGDYLQIPSQQGAMESGRIAAEEIIRLTR